MPHGPSGLLEILDATHAFDPVALPGYRSFLYTPFEELLGGLHEARLQNEISHSQRVALIGPIGSGKSSMIEYVLTVNEEKLAPIWISAGHEGTATLTDPPEFARHLIREVIGWARDAKQMPTEERQAFLSETSKTMPNRVTRHKQGVSLRLALGWIEPGISDEVEETLADPEVERSRGDFIDSLDRLVELIHDDLGRTPVVIIDDSDRWLRLEATEQKGLLDAFFADTCRMLAERNWGIVMAIHPEYCSADAFRLATTNGFLNVQIPVPQIDRSTAFRSIFDKRIQTLAQSGEEGLLLEAGIDPAVIPPPEERSIDDVFEPGFEGFLLEYYEAAEGNLRAVLTVAQQALQETIGLNERVITTAALREAALALAQ